MDGALASEEIRNPQQQHLDASDGKDGGHQCVLERESQPSSRAEELLPIMYHELRALARARLRTTHGGGHTLQPTALVHEAYMRLTGGGVGEQRREWNGPAHFFGAAAEAMRQVLVDYARAQGALKRGGDRQRLDFHDDLTPTERSASEDVLLVNEVVETLENENPLLATILKLRYFAGLRNEEAAAAIDMPLRTFERRWRYVVARMRELSGDI